MTDPLTDAFKALRARSRQVPNPTRLPDPTELQAVERTLGLELPESLRRYFLEASDVVVGYLEPATITNPQAHTHFPEIWESARAYGVPFELIPFCEDNADFYCLKRTGELVFWSHNGIADESWPDLATWIREVWLEEGG